MVSEAGIAGMIPGSVSAHLKRVAISMAKLST